MAQHPRNTEDHDVLVIPKGGQLQEVEVQKRVWINGQPDNGTGGGIYVGVKVPAAPHTPGYRKAMSIAQPAGDRSRGPLLACMPVRPEPASSYYTCYLVNGDAAKFKNDWTAAEWNEEPNPDPDSPDLWRSKDFEILLAIAQGVVVYLCMRGGQQSLREVDLSQEGEIWSQLRSGTVVGRVLYLHHPEAPGEGRVIPIVNVTAL